MGFKLPKAKPPKLVPITRSATRKLHTFTTTRGATRAAVQKTGGKAG